MRYRLRRLLIVLAIGPMVLAAGAWLYAELSRIAVDRSLEPYMRGGATKVEHPYPELIEELKNAQEQSN